MTRENSDHVLGKWAREKEKERESISLFFLKRKSSRCVAIDRLNTKLHESTCHDRCVVLRREIFWFSPVLCGCFFFNFLIFFIYFSCTSGCGRWKRNLGLDTLLGTVLNAFCKMVKDIESDAMEFCNGLCANIKWVSRLMELLKDVIQYRDRVHGIYRTWRGSRDNKPFTWSNCTKYDI